MTRDEHDLIALLERRADRAPDADAVRARLRDAGPRRTGRAAHPRRVLVAVAASVVVAGLSVTATHLTRRDSSGPSAPSPVTRAVSPQTTLATDPRLFDYEFRVRKLAGFTLQTRRIEPTRQTIVFSADRQTGKVAGTADAIDAVLYGPGGFDPTTVRTGRAVTVNGVAGWFGPAPGRTRASSGDESVQRVASVAWQYAPQRWAVVTGVVPAYRTLASELAIARSIDVSTTATARLPFRLGYLPTGMSATSVANDTDDTNPPAGGSGAVALFGRGTTKDTVRIEVSRVDHQSVQALFGTATAPLTVGGYPAKLDPPADADTPVWTLTIITPTFVITVFADPTVTPAELTLLGERMTYTATPDSPANWFPVRTALPH